MLTHQKKTLYSHIYIYHLYHLYLFSMNIDISHPFQVHQMHRLHFEPYIFSLNAALSALEKVGAWRPALRLLRRFEEWRVTATETTCSAVVSVPWRDGLGLIYIYMMYIYIHDIYIYTWYIYIYIYIYTYIYIYMYIEEYVCNQYIQYNIYRVPCCWPPPKTAHSHVICTTSQPQLLCTTYYIP